MPGELPVAGVLQIDKVGILELKSTGRGKIDMEGFGRTVHNFGYMIQGGWYAIAYMAAFDHWPQLHMVALEQAPPYDLVVYRIPDALLQEGARQALEIARLYRISEHLETFEGVAPEVVEFELPSYAKKEEEEWEVT